MKRYFLAPLSALLAGLAGCAPLPQNSGRSAGLDAAQAGTVRMSEPAAVQLPGSGGLTVPGYGQTPAAGMPAVYGQTPALIELLSGRLGISRDQSMGGAGAIFGLARDRMNPADFGRLSGVVPGMDGILAAAPQPAAAPSSGLLGAAGALLGNQAGTLGNLAALAGSFQSLGLSPDMIGQFVPVVLDYVQQQGGSAVMSLLQNALY